MKSGARFVGFDPAAGADWAAYVEITKLPDNTFKLEKILHAPSAFNCTVKSYG